MNTSTKKTIALVAASLISTTAVTGVANANEEKGMCHEINACKAETDCATAEGMCSGTNSCKGKGWLIMTEKKCLEKKGRFEAFQKISK